MFDVEYVLENTYFVFYILYNVFQRLLLVDTTNKKVDWKFRILVPGLCNIQVDKANGEDEIFLVIKAIDLIWNTFLSLTCVWGTSLKVLLKIININLALT